MENPFQSTSKPGMDGVEDQDAPGAAEGEGEYAVVQGVFATGFSVPGRTTPGFAIRSHHESFLELLEGFLLQV